MKLEFEVTGTVLTAKISGELDHHVSKELREKIDLKLATGVYNTLIFDFNNLAFTTFHFLSIYVLHSAFLIQACD